MQNPYAFERNPYGPIANSLDCYLAVPSAAPLEDAARSLQVLADGVLAFTTFAGRNVTLNVTAGTNIQCCVTHVLAATTATVLVYA